MVRGVALIACFLAVSAGAATRVPALGLVSRSPVVLRGTHFEARERVRVTLYTPVKLVKAVRATAAGSFLVPFSGAYAGRCTSLRAVAVAPSGTASLKLLPLPGCLPA